MRTRAILLPSVALVVVLGTSGCGSSTVPSPVAAARSAAPPAASPPSASPGAIASPSKAHVAVTDWHGFRGDAGHTGNAATGPVGRPVVNWQFHAKAAVPHAIAIIGDDVMFASDDGSVYALDRLTGKERWSVKAGTPTLIGPWAADDRLYFRDGTGAVLALDASTGQTLWTSAATYDGSTEPVADHGTVYVSTSDARIVAIDGATGAETWSMKPSPSTQWMGNPAVADGRLFVGSSEGFVAIDLATHKTIWTGDTHGEQTGTATANDGIAFIATGGDATVGAVRAFDAETGALRWMSAQQRLTFPVVADGLAFSSTMDGLVQAMDLRTGALRWSLQLTGKIRPMATANHVLYIAADTEKHVYAVDAASGSKLWQFDVDDSDDCCLAVTGGAVYVGTMAGTVYSIGGDGSAVAIQLPAASSAGPLPTPEPSAVPTAEIAVEQAWSTDLRQMGIAPMGQIAVDPTTGSVWIPEALGNQLAIVDSRGRLVETWAGPGGTAGPFDFTRQNGDGYGTLAFAKNGSFYVLDVGNRRVLHFDARRRLVGQWGGFGNGPGQFSDPVGIGVAPDGTVWVVDDRRSVVEQYTADGIVLGSFDPFATTSSNDGANNLFVDGSGRLYVSTVDPTAVFRFDAHGAFIDRIGEGAFPREQAGALAVDARGRMFVTQGPERGSAPGVLAFDQDGTPLGGFGPEGDGHGQIVFPGGIALDGKGSVFVFDSWPDSARLMKFTLPSAVR